MSFEGMAGGWELWLLDKGKGERGEGRQISFEWVTRKQNTCPLKGWREAGKVSFEGTAGGWDLCLLDIFNVFPRCSVVVGKGCLRRPRAQFPTGSLYAFSNGKHCLSRFPCKKPDSRLFSTFPSSFSKHALTSDPRETAFWMTQAINTFKF